MSRTQTARDLNLPVSLRPQQNLQRLPIRDLGPRLQLWRGATTDRMLDLGERIIRQAHDLRDILRRHFKRFGRQYDRPLTQLFKANAIMQTAR